MNSRALANLFVRKEWQEWKREMERNRRRRWMERLSRWAKMEGVSDEEDEEEEEEEETDDTEVSEDEEENGAVEKEMEMYGGANGGNEVRRVREMGKGGEEEVVEIDERVDVEEEYEVDEHGGEKEVEQDTSCEEEEGGVDEEEEGIEVETEVIREVDTEVEKEVIEAEEVEEEEKEVDDVEEKRVMEAEETEEEEGTEVVEVDERVDVEEEKEEYEVDERDGEEEVAQDMSCEEEEGIEVETEVIREVDTEVEKEVIEAEEVEEEEREVDDVDVKETEEEAEEGENDSESDVQENEGVVEEEEDRLVRGKEQEEEGDEEEEAHPEEAEHFRGQRRRNEDVTFEQSQERTSRDDRRVIEEENMASVTSDNNSTGFRENFYNSERINHEEKDVENQYEDPVELEENNILGAWASTERKEGEDESEMLRDEEKPAEESWTTQDEKEETTDDEEAEDSVDEDVDNKDEDVTKIYLKDDYFQVVFGTLKEFQDSSLLTDLTLSTDDGKSIHVHSPVLAAVSSLIRGSLSRSNVESNGGDERKDRGDRWLVPLGPEVDQVGLEAVVEFAYTGLMSRLNKNTVHQIKVAAQTLGAPRVLDLCTEDKETSTKAGGQEKEERLSAAEQMTISLRSIKQLWMDKVGCDVVLKALGGSLHVHRAILAAGSDYFRSMFTLGMKESHQSCVMLPFLLASELEVLIDCTYSGALSLSWSCVFEITSIALRLQYQPALSLCLNFLHKEINPHCCLDVVSFAEAYEMVQLLEAADDFVLRQFQKVACTSKFKDLPAKQLLKYLNSHSLCVPSELVVFKAVVAWIQARPRIRLKLAKELMKTIHFPLMTFKEFKEVQSLNMWSNHKLADLYETIFEDFCSNESTLQSQYRTYVPKESLILIGGDHTSEDLSRRNISRELWFGNSVRNHIGIRKAMEWRRLGEMPEPARFSHEVVVLKGQLYIFGGKKYYGVSDTLSSVYRYDPLQNSWEMLADMHEKRCSFAAVVLDGKIYAIGGQCGLDYEESVEQYCPIANSWGFIWPLDLPLGAHVAKVLQGQIFVSGGLSSNNQCLASMFQYHPETGSTYLANMAKPRAHHCMETLGECLYVAGGIAMDENMNVSDQLACEVYNPVTNSWTAFTSLPVPHVGAGSAVLEEKFYVLGGYSQEDYNDTKMVHRYDPATRSWENMGKMPGPNNDIRASLLCLPSHFRL